MNLHKIIGQGICGVLTYTHKLLPVLFKKQTIITLFIVIQSLDTRANIDSSFYTLVNFHFKLANNYPIKNFKGDLWDKLLVFSIHLYNDSGYNISEIAKAVYDNLFNTYRNSKNYNAKTKQYKYYHTGPPFEIYSNNTFNTRIKKTNIKLDNSFIEFELNNYKIALPQSLKNIKIKQDVELFYNSKSSLKAKQIATLVKMYQYLTIYSYKYDTATTKIFYNQILTYMLLSQYPIEIKEYFSYLDCVLSAFNDAHLKFVYTKQTDGIKSTKYYVPLNLVQLDGNHTVVAIDTSKIKNLKVGDVIKNINNIPINEFITNQYNHFSCPAISKYDYIVYDKLLWSYYNNDTFIVTTNHGKNISLTTNIRNPYVQKVENLDNIINDTILVINASSNELNPKRVIKYLKHGKITQIYLYIGSYPNAKIFKILPYVINNKITSPDFHVKCFESGGDLSLKKLQSWSISPKTSKNYKIFVYSYNAVSFGETIIDLLQTYESTILIGNRTIGTNGDVAFIDTPLGWFTMTGIQVSRNGVIHTSIEPDIYDAIFNVPINK